MNHKKNILLLLVFILSIFLGGCNPTKPDLVILPAPNDVQYCHTKSSGSSLILIISVKNQIADTKAKASTLSVNFGTLGIQTAAIPKLDTTDPVDIEVPIPSGCYNPDCSFTITVDTNNDVDESNEGNNSVTGTCIG